jgi:predicted lipoprotein with Yx(FWY)xxD motif
MRQIDKRSRMRQTVKVLIPTLAVSALLAACGSSSSSSTSSAASSAPAPQVSTPSQASTVTHAASTATVTVKSAANTKLGATVLVSARGMTLYSLSGEQNGKFICTSAACVQVWHPLAVSAGGTATGPVGHLSTVKRPDGARQVTYKGLPLYTFAQDHAPGDANGEGIKDVGTWNAVATSTSTSTATPAPAPAPMPSPAPAPPPAPSGGGSYGY